MIAPLLTSLAAEEGGDKGDGALAEAVLVGVAVGVGQTGDTAASEETLDVDRVLFVFQDSNK